MILLPEVRAMNHVNGRGLLMADGMYIAFDLVEGMLTVGDLIEGDLLHGWRVWRVVTSDELVQVYVQQQLPNVEAANRFYDRPTADR